MFFIIIKVSINKGNQGSDKMFIFAEWKSYLMTCKNI